MRIPRNPLSTGSPRARRNRSSRSSACREAVLHRQVPDLVAGYDLLVIDGPPSLTDIARSAMVASDLVLIPVTPSPYDVWAAGELVRLADEVRVMREDLAARFVISRKIVGTAIGRDVEAALAAWPSVPVLPAQVSQRVVFAETAAAGSTVLEAGRDGKAIREIEGLRDAILTVAIEGREAA